MLLPPLQHPSAVAANSALLRSTKYKNRPHLQKGWKPAYVRVYKGPIGMNYSDNSSGLPVVIESDHDEQTTESQALKHISSSPLAPESPSKRRGSSTSRILTYDLPLQRTGDPTVPELLKLDTDVGRTCDLVSTAIDLTTPRRTLPHVSMAHKDPMIDAYDESNSIDLTSPPALLPLSVRDINEPVSRVLDFTGMSGKEISDDDQEYVATVDPCDTSFIVHPAGQNSSISFRPSQRATCTDSDKLLNDGSMVKILDGLHDASLRPIFPPIPVWGGSNGRQFLADQVLDVDDVPVYPMSSRNSELGTFYSISLARMSLQQRAALHSNIGYSHLEPGSGNHTNVSYENAGKMHVRRFSCRGVKLCTALNTNVQHKHLGGASAETLLRRNAALSSHLVGMLPLDVPNDFRFSPHTPGLNNIQRAYAYAQEMEDRILSKQFCKHRSTNGIACSGLPIINHVTDTYTVSEIDSYGREVLSKTFVLNCTNWKRSKAENDHFTMWNLELKLDVPLFRVLMDALRKNGRLLPKPVYQCSSIYHFSSKKKWCTQLHGTSRCQLVPSNDILGCPCPVTFALLTPTESSKNQDRAYLYVTGGHHNHAPSPQDKTPKAIWDQIKLTLSRLGENVLHDQTPLQIREHGDILRLLESNDKETLEDLHPSLKPEVIADLIYRQRMTSAPDGRSFAGASMRCQRDRELPVEQRYIRAAETISDCSFVICFTDPGAKALYNTEYFEADLAFKRVKGAFNEMEIITYDQSQARKITHARIFMNRETGEAYKIAFRLLFNTIAEELKMPTLTFRHLNPQATLRALVSDFDTKQAVGLGEYLRSVDPENRQWNWQIQQCVRYCTVHFLRGIDVKFRASLARNYMRALLRCPSEESYYRQLDYIQKHWPPTANWCNHKRIPHIAAGLIQANSGLDEFVWQRIPNHTNVSESAHHAANAYGVRLSLLNAIDKSANADRRSDKASLAFLTTGARFTQKSKSVVTDIKNSLKQQEHRREKQRAGTGLALEEINLRKKDDRRLQSSPSRIVELDPDDSVSSPRGISSSGVEKGHRIKGTSKRHGRPKGSKNIAKPDTVPALAPALTQQNIFNELLISEADSETLDNLPDEFVAMFQRQYRLLLAEELTAGSSIAKRTAINALKVRNATIAVVEIQAAVRVGGMRLAMFKGIWDISLRTREALVEKLGTQQNVSL